MRVYKYYTHAGNAEGSHAQTRAVRECNSGQDVGIPKANQRGIVLPLRHTQDVKPVDVHVKVIPHLLLTYAKKKEKERRNTQK